MSTAIIERFAAERDEINAFIERTLTAATEGGRDLSDTEIESLGASKQRLGAIESQLKPLIEWQEQRASAAVVDRHTRSLPAPQQQPSHYSPARVTSEPGRSLGAGFARSDEFRAWINGGGTSARWTFDGSPSEVRATLTTGAAPGSLMVPNPQRWTAEQGAMLTPLLQAISRVPVTTGSVDIVQYGVAATGAAVVPEGQQKPEGTLTVTVTPTPLEVIAVYVKATRQLLADAAAAETYIDQQLTRGVLRALEDQVSDVITGAAIPTTTGAAGQSLLAVVRTAIAEVAASGWNPDVLLANPANMAALDLDILGLGGVSTALMGTGYWGLRAIPVPGFADTDIYVADASGAFTLFERSGVQTFVTDSDISGAGATAASDFRANIVTILTELRAKAAVVNNAAARKLALTPALP